MRFLDCGEENVGGRTSDCERIKESSGSSSSGLAMGVVIVGGGMVKWVGGGVMGETCSWLWRRAWRRVERIVGSVVLRMEWSACVSVLPMRVVRRVLKSASEDGVLFVGSVIP